MSTRTRIPAPDVETIGEAPEAGAFDEWLDRLPRGSEPRTLSVPASQLVAEGRADAE